MHLPLLWKFRLLRALHGKGNSANRQVLAAQARVEGGQAHYNPLNTKWKMPHSWNYNSVGVQDYRTGADGITAMAATFTDGYYPGIVKDFREGTKNAHQIVADNAAEWNKWGTGAAKMLAVL